MSPENENNKSTRKPAGSSAKQPARTYTSKATSGVKKTVSASGAKPVRRNPTAQKPSEAGTRTFTTRSATTVKKEVPAIKNTPSKRRRRKKSSLFGSIAKFTVYIAFVIGVSILLSSVCIKLANDMFAFVKEEREITIEVPENADTGDISKLLSDNGIIDYPTVFKFYTNYKKGKSSYYADGYKTGTFHLSPMMNYDDLIYTLSKNTATREIVRLTFPEGATVDEIIEILIAGGIKNTREQYIDVIQNYEYDYRFVKELDTRNFKTGRKYRLEGYLFPDTYDFYTDASPAAVIDKFLVNFNNKFDTSFYDAANKLEMSVDEIITIASLIEKESRRAEDSGLISSVFHNRLANSATYPYLQSDATVQYAFPERKSKITPEDLKYDTPYNTYLYRGLPPSAIANPGLDSITNALYPEKSSYYFFIANSKGETLFAKTLDGHNANIAMISKGTK